LAIKRGRPVSCTIFLQLDKPHLKSWSRTLIYEHLSTPSLLVTMSTLDLSSNYTLLNSFTGAAKALASSGDQLILDSVSTSSAQQQWYFTPTDLAGHYRLHTVTTGYDKSLDVYNDQGINSTRLVFASTGSYTGQFWRFDAWGDNTYRLSNNFTGQDMHLDVYSDTLVPHLASGDRTGQHWSLNRVQSLTPSSSNSSSSTTNSTSGTTSPTASPQSHSLSTGAIAGIAVGAFFGVLALLACAVFLLRRSKRQSQETKAELETHQYVASPEKKGFSATEPGVFSAATEMPAYEAAELPSEPVDRISELPGQSSNKGH